MNSPAELTSDAFVRRTGAAATSSIGSLVLPAYLLLCLASLVPFVLVDQPPIVDFANHAARLFLACNAGNPAVADMYHYRLGFIPNLAVDLVNLPLCGIAAPVTVLKAVTAGSLLAIYASAWLIQRKLFGRPNAFLFALPAIALNLVTTMGYMNFLAGIALSMLLVAVTLGREDKFRLLVPLCNVAGLLIFFCHIFALAFALLFFFGLQLGRGPLTARRFVEAGVRTGVLFALPLMLVLFVPGDGDALKIDYVGKIRMVVAPFMTQHPGVGIFGLVLLAPLYLLIRNGIVSVHPTLRAPLIAIAAYVVLVPSGIQDAVDVDARTLVALLYLFFTALQPLRQERNVVAAVTASSALLVAVELWATFAVWQPFSREVTEFRQASAALPSGAKVFSVTETDIPARAAFPLAYSHLASYATVDRAIFNPLEFTGIGMQPLSATPKFASVDTPSALPFSTSNALQMKHPTAQFERRARRTNAEFGLRWPEKFDYVIYYHFRHGPNFDPATLTLVRQGSFFSILKVKRPSRTRD